MIAMLPPDHFEFTFFKRALQLLLTIMACWCPSLAAFPLSIELTAAEVEYGDIRLQQVQLQSVGDSGIQFNIESAELASQPDLSVTAIAAQCNQLGSAVDGWCPNGEWQLLVQSKREGWEQTVQGTLQQTAWNEKQQNVSSSLAAGKFQAQLQFTGGGPATGAAPALDLKWSAQNLSQLPFQPLLPEQLAWIKSGSSSGKVSVIWPQESEPKQTLELSYQLQLSDISLDSPDGRFAAEGLKLRANGQWQPGDTSQLTLETEFLAGEVLLDQFYTAFGPHSLQLNTRLSMSDSRVEVHDLRLTDGSTLQLQANGDFSMADPFGTLSYRVKQLAMQFPMAYGRYLEPVLAIWTLDKLTVTGGFSWVGRGEGGGFPSGILQLEDLSVVDNQRSRFAFTGMSARIEVGQSTGQSIFAWRGMLLGRINLGAGQIALDTAPGLFELAEPLQLDVLGGKFLVDEFSLELPAAEAPDQDPVVNFNAGLDAMDMTQLTEALGWPTFAGKISGRVPGVSFDQGVLTVDGVLSFEAFDGQIQLTQLRIERLFGVLPSMAANLDVHNLDLELLTSAFSFGSIAGRLDGYVHDLRMLDWSPVSFDAWMGTPERQADSRSISRQAVNHLTSIGGGGATAALTGPIMRLFSNFSYRRLGMGCKLENYVCVIRGLAEEDNSVLIMEGSGIPKLSIRVFNRSMDWPQLVSNLAAVSSGEEIRIGDP